MNPKLVEVKNLMEKEIARGSEATEEMLTEHDDLSGGR